jgi:MATE family multidrug resistance protein
VCSTRVANELGAGNARLARNVIKSGFSLSLSITMIISVVLLCIHNVVGQLFSNDDDVISYVSKIAPMLSISMFFDSTQATLSG